ncbi:MAG: hypothetical protein ATN31_07645 [Candidatus Epulonipiscioides saccharophilum]|nr:MAG: hypothetical protein ATN31_07645 [Epulopiscium sp. AS2M-Bin001]
MKEFFEMFSKVNVYRKPGKQVEDLILKSLEFNKQQNKLIITVQSKHILSFKIQEEMAKLLKSQSFATEDFGILVDILYILPDDCSLEEAWDRYKDCLMEELQRNNLLIYLMLKRSVIMVQENRVIIDIPLIIFSYQQYNNYKTYLEDLFSKKLNRKIVCELAFNRYHIPADWTLEEALKEYKDPLIEELNEKLKRNHAINDRLRELMRSESDIIARKNQVIIDIQNKIYPDMQYNIYKKCVEDLFSKRLDREIVCELTFNKYYMSADWTLEEAWAKYKDLFIEELQRNNFRIKAILRESDIIVRDNKIIINMPQKIVSDMQYNECKTYIEGLFGKKFDRKIVCELTFNKSYRTNNFWRYFLCFK